MARSVMTPHARMVLLALMAEPGREMYGLEIIRAAGLPSGSVYPMLERLRSQGWVSVRGEEIDPRAEGRPRRRYYRITPKGAKAFCEDADRSAAQLAALGVKPPGTAPGSQGPLRIGGITIPVIADDRQPPGIVSVAAPGEEKTEVRSFALAAEEPAPKPARKPRAKTSPKQPPKRPGTTESASDIAAFFSRRNREN